MGGGSSMHQRRQTQLWRQQQACRRHAAGMREIAGSKLNTQTWEGMAGGDGQEARAEMASLGPVERGA